MTYTVFWLLSVLLSCLLLPESFLLPFHLTSHPSLFLNNPHLNKACHLWSFVVVWTSQSCSPYNRYSSHTELLLHKHSEPTSLSLCTLFIHRGSSRILIISGGLFNASLPMRSVPGNLSFNYIYDKTSYIILGCVFSLLPSIMVIGDSVLGPGNQRNSVIAISPKWIHDWKSTVSSFF